MTLGCGMSGTPRRASPGPTRKWRMTMAEGQPQDAAPRRMRRGRGDVYIGVQGFSSRDWVGTFYPTGWPAQEFLPFYSQVFDSVELNTTFYAIPPVSTVQAWARRTPPGFVFTTKLPRAITHDKKLLDVKGELYAFIDSVRPLGAKLGAAVVQFPPSFTRQRFADRFRAFLLLLPEWPRFAVEFRSRSWHNEDVFDLLREFRVAWCINHWQNLPAVVEATTDFAYLRLVGHHDQSTHLGRLQRDRSEELASLSDMIRGLSARLGRVYVYVNNHYEGHAPATVTRLKALLGLPTVEPLSLWPQRQGMLPGMPG